MSNANPHLQVTSLWRTKWGAYEMDQKSIYIYISDNSKSRNCFKHIALNVPSLFRRVCEDECK